MASDPDDTEIAVHRDRFASRDGPAGGDDSEVLDDEVFHTDHGRHTPTACYHGRVTDEPPERGDQVACCRHSGDVSGRRFPADEDHVLTPGLATMAASTSVTSEPTARPGDAASP